MENLIKLKESILHKKDYTNEIEACYSDFLNSFDFSNATIFLNLLEMCESNRRLEEILKVFDFIRFPVKKAVVFDCIWYYKYILLIMNDLFKVQ